MLFCNNLSRPIFLVIVCLPDVLLVLGRILPDQFCVGGGSTREAFRFIDSLSGIIVFVVVLLAI